MLHEIIEISQLILLIFVDWSLRFVLVSVKLQFPFPKLFEVVTAKLIWTPGADFEAFGISGTTEPAPTMGVLCEIELIDRCEVEMGILVLEGGEYRLSDFFQLFLALGFSVVGIKKFQLFLEFYLLSLSLLLSCCLILLLLRFFLLLL